MNHETLTQIAACIKDALGSKHGPLYAALFSVVSLTLGYLFIDNRYGLSDGDRIIQPHQEDKYIEGSEMH